MFNHSHIRHFSSVFVSLHDFELITQNSMYCQDVLISMVASHMLFQVIIPCSQCAKLNFNPSPKSNQVFNPSKFKHNK